MKKQIIVGHSGNVTMQPSEQKALMYECSAVERRDVSVAEGSLVHSPDNGDIATDTHDRKRNTSNSLLMARYQPTFQCVFCARATPTTSRATIQQKRKPLIYCAASLIFKIQRI